MGKFEVKPIKFKHAVNQNFSMIADGLPKPTRGGFACTLLGKRKSGKSNLVCNMILNGGYKKAFNSIVILSPTVFLDRTYTSLHKLDNVLCSDKVNNETLENILQIQKGRYLSDPKNSSMLLVLDDSGPFFKTKEAKKQVEIYYSTARQYNCSIICCVQSVTMLTSIQFSNSSYWCIWALDNRALKKISNDLSCHLTPKEFEGLVRKATAKPYDFLFVDMDAESEGTFKKNFTEPI